MYNLLHTPRFLLPLNWKLYMTVVEGWFEVDNTQDDRKCNTWCFIERRCNISKDDQLFILHTEKLKKSHLFLLISMSPKLFLSQKFISLIQGTKRFRCYQNNSVLPIYFVVYFSRDGILEIIWFMFLVIVKMEECWICELHINCSCVL